MLHADHGPGMMVLETAAQLLLQHAMCGRVGSLPAGLAACMRSGTGCAGSVMAPRMVTTLVEAWGVQERCIPEIQDLNNRLNQLARCDPCHGAGLYTSTTPQDHPKTISSALVVPSPVSVSGYYGLKYTVALSAGCMRG